MAKDRILLLEQLRKAGVDGDVDFLRDGSGCWRKPSWI